MLNSIENSYAKELKRTYPKELNNNFFADRGTDIIGKKTKKEFRHFTVQINFYKKWNERSFKNSRNFIKRIYQKKY